MNNIDIIICLFLVFGLFRGFMDGFFVALASLLALVVGIYGAIHFSHFTASFLFDKVSWSESKVNLVAFAVTFLVIVVVIHLMGKFLTQIANFAALGIVNKVLGAIFGIFRSAFIVSVIILFFNEINDAIKVVDQETLDDSILYSPIEKIAPAILPSIIKRSGLEEETE